MAKWYTQRIQNPPLARVYEFKSRLRHKQPPVASHDESASFEARADALYALPLDEFVAGRKRLADELKREGARDEARRFGGLAKPALSAWLTNQTVRHAPELVRDLLAATEDVAVAQRKLPAPKGGPSNLADAVAAQRKILAQLAEQARTTGAKLGPAGATDDVLGRVANNFRWGAIAAADREALARGRLIRDVEAPGFAGFGEVTGGNDAPAPPPAKEKGKQPPLVPERDPKAEALRAAEAARAAAQAERERREAIARHEAALRDAEREVARARRELAQAENERADADRRVADAEAELASAREARDTAERQRSEAAAALASHEAAEANLRRAR